MRRSIVKAGLAVSLALAGVAGAAEPAGAISAGVFRSATLEHRSGPGLHNRVLFRTHDLQATRHVRVFARADGIRAHARRIAGTTRFEVSRHSGNGRALVHALREDLERDGSARLHANARFPCGSRFIARFRIVDVNVPAPVLGERRRACS